MKTVSSNHLINSYWESFENDIKSYYIKYEESKHYTENRINIYEFETPADFKKMLDILWEAGEYDKLKNINDYFIRKNVRCLK